MSKPTNERILCCLTTAGWIKVAFASFMLWGGVTTGLLRGQVYQSEPGTASFDGQVNFKAAARQETVKPAVTNKQPTIPAPARRLDYKALRERRAGLDKSKLPPRKDPKSVTQVNTLSTMSVSQTLTPQSLSAKPAPLPTASFPALQDNGARYEPNPSGAVGSNHLMVATENQIVIQDRAGTVLSSVSLDGFWSPIGVSNVYSPHVLYDPYRARFIMAARAFPTTNTSKVLLGVSQTSDPTGNWYLYSSNIAYPKFPDSISVGFNTNWVVLQADIADQTTGYLSNSVLFVFIKTNIYVGGPGKNCSYISLSPDEGNYQIPAITYNPTITSLYLMNVWDPYYFDGISYYGFLKIYKLSGTVTAPTLSDSGYTSYLPWEDAPLNWDDLLPQAGVTNKLYAGDSRLQSVVYRDSLYATHTIFLPTNNPSRAVVQFWETVPSGSAPVQLAQIDGFGGNFYAYPSLAVNRVADVLLAYGRFSSTQFPSASYSFHANQRDEVGDPSGAFRADTLIKAGEAPYVKTDPHRWNQNYWGGYSAAIVDPLNDSDMWTLQPYASTTVDGQGRWGLWWARVTPPSDLGVQLYSQTAILAGFSMTNWIYVTNGRPCHVDDVMLTNTLPTGSGLVSVTLSQGSYLFTNGQVICNFGSMEGFEVASAIVVLTPVTAGQITNTATVGCRGADADIADNFASTRTTVTPTADLAVSVITVPSVVNVGSRMSITVQVTNRGGFTATGVMLTNTYPSTMTIGPITASMGTVTRSGNIIIWNVNNNLSVGANPTLVYDLTPAAGGQMTNSAIVGSTSVDLQPANNTAVNVSRANAYPTIQALSARTVNEDTSTGPISFTVGDLETPAANLTVFAISSNEALIPTANIQFGGTASNRTITVTPLLNLSGTATITRYVVDADGATNSSAFVLTIAPVNDPPTLNPLANMTIDEDSRTQTVPLSGISGGPANEPQVVSITATSSLPSLIGPIAVNYTGGASGSISFTPLTNAFGTATITVTVNDGVSSNNLASQSFTVTVNPINDPPTLNALPDVVLNEDVGSQTNLLTGISGGPSNEPQPVTITASNSNPSLLTGLAVDYTTGSSGTLTYSTVSNAFGTATITIIVNDNAGSNNIVTRSFNITVNPINDFPAIDPINDFVVSEDAPTQSIPLTGISSGAANENQTLSVSVTNSGSNLLANLSVLYTSPNSTGNLSFDLLPNAFGTNQVTVIVRDDGTSNNVVTRTFKVIVTPVDDPPTLDTLPNLSLNEDFGNYTVNLTGITAGPTNEPAAGLTISATSDNPSVIPSPSVTYTAPANTGTLQLSSVQDAFGTANVTVTVNDGGSSNNIITRTFQITVNPVNDLPTLNPIANITIPEDAGLQTVNLGGIGSGAENEVQSLTVTASNGTPSLLTNVQISYTSPASTAVLSFGTVSNASGNATITVSVNDRAASNNIVSQSFTIFITPVNDPPNMDTPANLTLDEDFGTYRLTLTGINAGPANEPQQSLSITAASSVPSVLPNPVVNYTPGSSTATLQFTSLTNASGMATITVRLDDGAGSNNVAVRTFTVTVQPVNDLPVISAINNQEMDENTALTVPITVWDLETPANRLVLSAISFNEEVITPAGVSFTGTGTNRTMTLSPLTNQYGTATLLIMVQDTDGGTAYSTFDLNVHYVNTPPIISSIANQNLNEDASVTVLFTVSDAVVLFSNIVVTVSNSNPALLPSSGVVLTRTTTNCLLKLTPASDQFGTATVTITADNSGPTNNISRLSFTVSVSPVNDLPTLDTIAPVTLNEDAGVQTIILTGISAGPQNEIQTNLTLSSVSDNTNIIPTPVLAYTNGLSTATLKFAPAPNAYGSCTITVTANDGGASNNIITRSFQVTVNPVNDPPTLAPLSNLTINEDAGLQTVNLTGISPGALETQSLTITATNFNPELISNLDVNYSNPATTGTLTFGTVSNASGTTTIFVTVNDHAGSNNIVTQSFTVTINPVNDAPTLNPINNLTLAEDFGSSSVNLSGISSGAYNESQTLVVSASSSDTSIIPNPTVSYSSPATTGTLQLNSLTNAYGTVTITVTVNDGGASNNIVTRSFTITVTPVNDLPFISTIADQVTDEDIPVIVPFVVGDTETVNLILSNSFSNSALLSTNSFLFGGSGSNRTVTIRPITNQFGSSIITLTVRDADGATASTTFNLTVNPVNDPPAISAITDKFTAANTPAVVSFVMTDAENAPGDLLVAGSSSNPALIPQSGIAFAGSGSNLTITLTPLLNQIGNSTISITAMDTNGATTVSSFVLTVTNGATPPKISTLPNLTINEDTVAGPLSFVVGDLGTPVSNLVVSATSSNPTLVPPANIILAGTGPDRTVAITPVANLYGNSTIILTVSDGVSSNSTSFVLSVAPVNDPPTLNPIGNLSINQDSGLQTVALSGISSGPNETNSLTITAVSSNPSLIPNPTVNYTSPSAAGSLTFTPVAHVAGSAVITVTVNDNAGSNNIVIRTFTVTVNAVNTAPTISAISAKTTAEDTPINIPFNVSDNESAALALTVTGTSTNTALVPNANLYFDGNGTNRILNVVPASNLSGTTLITLTVSDGAATANTSFLLTVSPENDPPTLNPIPPVFLKAGNNPGSTTINLTGISSGASNESQTLSISVSNYPASFFSTQPYVTYTSPNATGTITFTPAKNVIGTNLITVTVKDNGTSNNVVRQSFLVYSRSSSATPPAVSGIANQTTAENTATAPIPFTVTPGTSITLAGLSSNPKLIPNSNIIFGGSGTSRTVTLIPATNATGVGVVTVTVSDANYAGTNIQFTLTVNAVNSGPVISTLNNLTINEDTSTGPIAFTISDSETPADDLTVTATSSNQALVPNANILPGGSGTNRALQITPAANQSGTATITVSVSDGVNSRSNSFILTVNEVNDLPSISAIADQRIGQAGATAPLAFTIGDLETAAGSLTLSAASSNTNLVPNANIAFSGSGSNRTVTVTPVATQSGYATITVTVSDGQGGTANTSFVLAVDPGNRPPTLNAISDVSISRAAGNSIVIPISGISAGGENQTLNITASSSNPVLVPNPVVNYTSPNSTGNLVLTAQGIANGTATITVTVNDGQAPNNILTRTFNVSVNGLPSISNIPVQSTAEDTPTAAIPFIVSDYETAAGNLVVAASSRNTSLVPNANIQLGGSGSNRTVRVTPAAHASGSTWIDLTVTDTSGAVVSNTFLLDVLWVQHTNSTAELRIRRSGTRLTLSWSTDIGLAQLQARENCNPTNTWSTLNVTPVISNGEYQVTVDPVGPSRIYRLLRQPAAGPLLHIRRSGNRLILAWSTDAGLCQLQARENCNPTNTWFTLNITPVITNGEYQVTVDPVGSSRIYRLLCQPASAPSLQISSSSGGAVLLSWPTNYTGFTLQSCPNLTTATWTTLGVTPVISNGLNNVSVTATGALKFYRLIEQ